MKYEDSKNPSDLELSLLARNYTKIQEKETSDLKEILQKMKKQREYLISANETGQYDQILPKMEENIVDMERLIQANSKHLSQNYQKQLGEMPFKLQPKDIFSSLNNSSEHYNDFSQSNNGGDLNRENMSPDNSDRNIDDDIQNGNSSDNLNMNTTDSESNGISENDNSSDLENTNENMVVNENSSLNNSSRNNAKRNSPMQSNFIFNAFKRFNVNMNRIFGRHSSTNSKWQKENYPTFIKLQRPPQKPFPPKPPYDRPYPERPLPPFNEPYPDNCDINDLCRNNQIDIIRLFLLYMTLCPTCKYLPQISHIANDQFDIFIMMNEGEPMKNEE